jgi:predicted alpha/beta-hydrolase family hydrolase
VREVEVDLDGHPGLVVRPRGARALYVVAHGAGAGMRHVFMTDIAAALAERAIATLRYEFPYMAAGRGRPDTPAVAEATVHAVWRAAATRYGALPRFAGGKSFGGRMTSRAHAAEPLAALRGIVFLGFPLHAQDKPGSSDEIAMRRRASAAERSEHLARASGPLLFLQGTRDELADLALVRPVIAALGPRATLHVIDGADHGFDVLVRSGTTRERVIDALAATIAEWIAGMLDS